MSKASLKSKTPSSRFRLQRRRKQQEKEKFSKPYGFCCSIDNIDPLTKYDRLRSLYKRSLTSVHRIKESPTLKFRTECINYEDHELRRKGRNKQLDIGDFRHKNYRKIKQQSKLYEAEERYRSVHNQVGHNNAYHSEDIHDFHFEDLHDKQSASLQREPLKWYLEDEIAAGKNILWQQKQNVYNEEWNRNTRIGKKKTLLAMKQDRELFPRWYQDFSVNQMQNLRMLQCIMHKDCEEMITGRTQRMLISIGIVSTFFKLSPDIIKKLQESSNCNVIKFLREIYKILTGNYFEEEGYKKFYDCNERIILSAIAFLTLPETVVELHKRLPPVTMPKLHPKPTPPMLSIRQKMKSPYKEELFTRPDWASYYNRLQHWQENRQLTPIPAIILPPRDCILNSFPTTNANPYSGKELFQNNQLVPIKNNLPIQTRQTHNVSTKRKDEKRTSIDTKQKHDISVKVEDGNPINNFMNSIELNQDEDNSFGKEDNKYGELKQRSIISNTINADHAVKYNSATLDVPPLYGENTLFDFTINGICEKSGPVEYKICGILQPPQPNKKSWLNQKHAHYIISGASDEPPTCPITYEMTGVANVTPSNSDERFFAVLKLGDGPNKIYPSGRQNLSRHWQEWLQNVDEEFRKVEREANKMIKSIEAVTKLVFPEPTCDSCCSCRQTRKSYLRAKETKAPYFVIDTIAEDDKRKKYIVGSMALHSPAPTPPESTVNLLEVIASEDVLKDKVIISGVTDEKGETQYFISGTQKEMIRTPARIVEHPPPRPPRNVPPCVCAIHQVFNKDLTSTLSHDNIPWTKEDGLCFGKKFRPHESPAYSCKMYPGDKSCRRSPFMHRITKLQMKAEKARKKTEVPTGEKKMYSIADFKPCGDEHGMGICGGPWGALHTLTSTELAEQERQRKEILRGPPCGTKPGRAICEGPFGARVPMKPPKILIEEEIPGEAGELEEEEEEEIEEEEEVQKPFVEVKKKELKRDTKCHMSPEAVAERRKVVEEKKIKKFIPDPTYPGYDDPWNIFRTAPSVKESETDFKKLLKLSSPKPPATPIQSKSLINEDKKLELQEDVLGSGARTDDTKASTDLKKTSVKKSKQISKKETAGKFKSEEKLDKITSKPVDKKTSSSVDTEKTSNIVVRNKVVDSRKEDRKFKKWTNSKQHQKMDKKSVISNPLSKKGSQNPKSSKSGISKILEISEDADQFNKNSKQSIRDLTNYKTNKQNRKEKEKKKSGNKSLLSVNIKRKKLSKQLNLRRKSIKRDKKKDSYNDQDLDPETMYKNKIHQLKNMMKSSENYPYDVVPVQMPENQPTKCKMEYEDTESITDVAKTDEDTDIQLPSKGPCGWRTKSEQKLPTKKTLVYLSEPDYPPETVPVKPGGRPCLCRENRAKKKILLYNIDGLIGGKKEVEEKKLLRKKKDEDKKMQVIGGTIYYTPPPSPRRSDEYVPEYDLYESPYDMCLTQRKDQNLKFISQYGKPKISDVPENREPCGCSQYMDTNDTQVANKNDEEAQLKKELDKTREILINEKPPKDRWKLALQDVALVDYFTRCRDSLPCWLKCNKFNKVGCPIPRPKLKTKRPVCECKYERKILENKEQKLKYKERQKRLKSLKKQPYVNVADISKPLVPNTKLMISDVKRIPRDNEYVDDIKYCITGVAENYSHLPPKQVVGGIHMSTPVHTPEPSKDEIPCVRLHRHWSSTNIPPGPLPKPEELLLDEKKRRQKAVIEAFRQIYTPEPTYHTHDDHSCKEKCGETSKVENDESKEENGKAFLHDNYKNTFKSNITDKTSRQSKNVPQTFEHKKVKDFSQLQHSPVKLNRNVDTSQIENEESPNVYNNAKDYLMTIVKVELKKMAADGFLFAKLPRCFLLPQLRYWLMYRNGIVCTSASKNKSVQKSLKMWNMIDMVTHKATIEPAPLDMTKLQLRNLTYDDASKMKAKVSMKKATFHSQIRKERVLYSRSMWNTMDYEKFPSVSFKEMYFTYMAGKEADGHVFKPWQPSEVHEMY
ncbi:uncharacterized protein LOC143428160 isoform X2 [Xylocopa sonorina]|uniref:uncharacterized protein LOC143428160 isoform X2 n=1 Tax=Xylocopa sonorina TaxID=1818115 RepID=UPI00403AA2B8